MLSGGGAEALSIGLLLAILAFAVARPRGLPEAAAAVPGAALIVGAGAVSLPDAWSQVRSLLPVVAFLAAVLILARLCHQEGLFGTAAGIVARACRGQPVRLLAGIFLVASLTTAVLSLDATVVLLTPVVFATATRLGARSRPHVYACTHLANSASLLLPVSNLTNLLAFAASGLSFLRFAVLMAPAWVITIVIEFVMFRWFFRADLAAGATVPAPAERVPIPVFTLAVLGGTLAGFAVTSFVGVDPVWAAFAGAVALGVRAWVRKRTTVRGLVSAASPLFLLFVLALGIVVRGVVDNGLASGISAAIPQGGGVLALLGVATVAALLANLINNVPAVLALLPVVALGGPGLVLAALVGVNVGPNLTYVGSLATLLWRRVLRHHGAEPALREFTLLAVITVPATLVAATLALWVMLRTVGG